MQGNTFTDYVSSDCVNWMFVGSETVELSLTAQVGLAATSHDNGVTTTATFSEISIVSP